MPGFMSTLQIILVALLTLGGPLTAKAYTVCFLTGSEGLGDESFNDMTYKGLGQAQRRLGFDLEVREWEQDISMEELFLQLLEKEPELVVLNGNQFLPLIEKYARRLPRLDFIANDFDAGSYPNVKSIVYSQHEGAFLAGVLAANMSKTRKIGFLGAIDIEVIKAFRTGFIEGAQYASKDTMVVEEYISRFPDYTGFNNPHQGLELALSLYGSGVDVIFAVAGLSGNGIIQAAKIKGKYVIGVDSNQDHMAKGYVLTSVMKRLDTAVYIETVKTFGEKMKPGTVWYGLANGGVSLTPMEYTADVIPERVRKHLHKIEKQIISGKITVTNSLLQSPPAIP
jgi:basic membrane protein A